jgi:transcriptional regulator with XRE-family HTH domain
MALTILSEVTSDELVQLKLNRQYKGIERHYGMLLRELRLAQNISLKELQVNLALKDIKAVQTTICRWERNKINPPIKVIGIWADCLGLKMSVFVDVLDRRLVDGDFALKLKTLREDLNIRQTTVAKQVGVRVESLSNWERGIKSPSETELKDWAKALGATACLVFERRDSKQTH